eukprot:3487852-Rhodomonas_salina.2
MHSEGQGRADGGDREMARERAMVRERARARAPLHCCIQRRSHCRNCCSQEVTQITSAALYAGRRTGSDGKGLRAPTAKSVPDNAWRISGKRENGATRWARTDSRGSHQREDTTGNPCQALLR